MDNAISNTILQDYTAHDNFAGYSKKHAIQLATYYAHEEQQSYLLLLTKEGKYYIAQLEWFNSSCINPYAHKVAAIIHPNT